MSNSSLVSYTKLSPNYNARTHKIEGITIHHTGCVNPSLQGLGNGFAKASAKASANYGIDVAGKIGMYVEEKNQAMTSSNKANDQRCITIEVGNCKGAPNWEVSDKTMESLIKLCVDICKRNEIKELKYTGDKNGTLTIHSMFSATVCPGPYLKSKLEEIAAKVNAELTETAVAPKEEAPKDKPLVIHGVELILDKSLATKPLTPNSWLNLREGPGVQYNVKIAMPPQAEIKFYGYYQIDKYNNYWYYVEYNYNNVKYTGFCNRFYLV